MNELNKIPEANYHVSSCKILICKTHTNTQSCNLINPPLLDVNNWHSKCGCFSAAYLLLGNDEKWIIVENVDYQMNDFGESF